MAGAPSFPGGVVRLPAMGWLGVVLVGLVMAVGLVGVILPFVPGTVLIWGAGLVYGLVEGFDAAGWGWFAAMTVLAVLGQIGQYALPSRAGLEAGASWKVLAVGALAGIVGFFVIPVVGLPIGAVLGVLAAEYGETGDWARALTLTRQVVIGFGLGILSEFLAGLLMILTWVAWVVAVR